MNRAVNYSKDKKNILLQIDELRIFQTEIDVINALDLDDVQKQVVFAVLVKKKLDEACYAARHDEEYTLDIVNVRGQNYVIAHGDYDMLDLRYVSSCMYG